MRVIPGRRPASAIVLSVLVLAHSAGCATQTLWKATDPDARVVLSPSKVSTEELRSRGIPYTVQRDGFVSIGKTQPERMKDHWMRATFTPATVLLDVVTVGGIILIPLYVSGKADQWARQSGGYTAAEANEQALQRP